MPPVNRNPLRVNVLSGGPSSEREVSLTSGRAVAAALKEAGHDVFLADVTPEDLSALDRPCDVTFPVLHGQWGESGELQELLEGRGLPFVGSGSASSRLGMDKVATKEAWHKVGLPTPAFRLITRPDVFTASGPCVIKPVDGGSSIDCFVRRGSAESTVSVEAPVSYLVAKYGRCMIEQFIDGYELTCGILFDQALPLIWVDASTSKAGWFDYEAKYKPGEQGGAAHRFDMPPVVGPETVAYIQSMCLDAHRAVGCRDMSRLDVMVDRSGKPYLLEINTIPGFTGRSLLPDAAREAGISFADLCDRLVQAAAGRADAAAAA